MQPPSSKFGKKALTELVLEETCGSITDHSTEEIEDFSGEKGDVVDSRKVETLCDTFTELACQL